MDASLAQSAIVWLALGVGLASVLLCVFSTAAPAEEDGQDPSGPRSEPLLDGESLR
jgi:hypothetical protein